MRKVPILILEANPGYLFFQNEFKEDVLISFFFKSIFRNIIFFVMYYFDQFQVLIQNENIIYIINFF